MNQSSSSSFSFPEVRVVEASAGSGKTYALAKRYVQLLINPSLKQEEIPLRAILAITFTNKATIEMKERILEFLKKIALRSFSSPAEEEDILSSLGVPPEAARQKAFFIMDYVIRNYNFFQVQTIDSFVNAILAGCAFRLNLSSHFTVRKDGYREYLAYSLDALIDRAAGDHNLSALFTGFLKQYLHVENRSGWFPKKNILALVEDLYAKSNSYGGDYLKRVPATADDLMALKGSILQKAQQLREGLPRGTNGNFARYLGSFVDRHPRFFAVDDLPKAFSYEEFPANKGVTVDEKVRSLWDALRFEVRRLCGLEAFSFYNCYIDIFALVDGDFRRRSSRDDVLFLPELNKQANALFTREGVGVPELYYRLATRFRHFLVDEFQDTSELQWKNIEPMAEEALSTGGSLFYVGDKKQAIYRFRGGDATLFDRVPVAFRKYGPRTEVLGTNYRSHREIVEFNNALFSTKNLNRFIADFQAEDDELEALGAVDLDEVLTVFSDAQQRYLPANDRGRVCVRFVDARTVEERDGVMRGTVIGLIRELKERFDYRDIALLARDNSDIELLTGWLLEERIPVESEKTLNIRENTLVKELISLLTFLHSPIDNLAFASFLLGGIFTKASALDPGETADFVTRMATARAEGRTGYLYREWREQHESLWNTYFEEFFVNVGFVPLYELAVSILARFKVMERFPEHQVFLMRFLELIKQQEDEEPGIAAFLSYFNTVDDNELFVTVPDTDSVRLLTIHKAKGLEFPVVIIPFLDIGLKGGDRNGSFDILHGEEGLALVRLGKKYALYSEELRRLYVERFKRSLIDELNAVYVALTRPRCELYAFVPEKASGRKNPVRHLIGQEVDRGTAQRYPQRKKPSEAALLPVPVTLFQDWIGLLKDEFREGATLLNRDNVRWGEALHYALSFVQALPGDISAAEITALAGRARDRYPLLPPGSDLEKKLSAVLHSPKVRHFFAVEGQVFCEKEITAPDGTLKRIDRLVVKPQEAWVIDFKSAPGEGDNYHKQVREYMEICEALYPEKAVKGFIIYMDSCTFEEINN